MLNIVLSIIYNISSSILFALIFAYDPFKYSQYTSGLLYTIHNYLHHMILFFGYSIILFPIVFFIWGCKLLYNNKINHMMVKLALMPVVLILLSSILNINNNSNILGWYLNNNFHIFETIHIYILIAVCFGILYILSIRAQELYFILALCIAIMITIYKKIFTLIVNTKFKLKNIKKIDEYQNNEKQYSSISIKSNRLKTIFNLKKYTQIDKNSSLNNQDDNLLNNPQYKYNNYYMSNQATPEQGAYNHHTEYATQVEHGPQVRQQAEYGPQVRQQAEYGPQVRQQAEYGPQVRQQAEHGPQVRQQAEYGPQVRQQAEHGPQVRQQAEYGPQVRQQAEYGPQVRQQAEHGPQVRQQTEYEAQVRQQAEYEAQVKQQAEYEAQVRQQAEYEAQVKQQAEYEAQVRQQAEYEAQVKQQAEYEAQVRQQAEYEAQVRQQAEYEAQVKQQAEYEAQVNPQIQQAVHNAQISSQIQQEEHEATESVEQGANNIISRAITNLSNKYNSKKQDTAEQTLEEKYKNQLKRGDAPSSHSIEQFNTTAEVESSNNYHIPITFLNEHNNHHDSDINEINSNIERLEVFLSEFNIKTQVTNVMSGPVVTTYELEIPPGIKSSKIINLESDIAIKLRVDSIRISSIPGKDVIGVEIPNKKSDIVSLRDIIQNTQFTNYQDGIPLCIGSDIYGNPVVQDLTTMPHLLVAGTTGSGKSVSINVMILSIIYKFNPQDCKLIMIDPKMLEFSIYQDIPHLITPVITKAKDAVSALNWAVSEMEYRYKKMSFLSCRNIKNYNEKIKDKYYIQTIKSKLMQESNIEINFDKLPFIVIIIDEMADLMSVAGKEVEHAVQRLSQMARASGIHLIMATQRPSVDVITGTIKANFPTRISFKVSSKIDSRTIIDQQGAEKLLGRGDMLMSMALKVMRIHAPFVSDPEVDNIVEHVKKYSKPDYIENIIKSSAGDKNSSLGGNGDDMYEDAIEVIRSNQKVSISFLQRKLQIGYNRAARIVEQLEEEGLISPPNSGGKRDIYV